MNIQDIYTKFRRSRYKLKRVWREIWPISFKKFTIENISQGVSSLSYSLKLVLSFLSIIFVISTGLVLYSSYITFTVKVAKEGGYIKESTIDNIDTFNPVLDDKSDAEQKINRLLYHPLYEVKYPDYYAGEDINDIEITPVLLEKVPEFTDLDNEDPSNRYKSLKMTLKLGLKWSDGSDITMSDLLYSFRRLQEDGGNAYFKGLFRNLTFKEINEKEFLLISEESNPRLLYLSNFTPISKEYYGSETNSRLIKSIKSKVPEVTSGYYTFSPDKQIENPYDTKEEIINPLVEDGENKIVVLSKNPYQNTEEEVYISNYAFKKYSFIRDQGGKNNISIESDSDAGNVDLYFRSADFENEPSSIRSILNINQDLIPTNNFYSAYFNTKPSSDGYFINQTFRKYVACHMINYKYENNEFFENIDPDKRLIPIQFNDSHTPDCPEDLNSILDPDIYTITNDERTGIKRVYLNTTEINLRIVGYAEYLPLLTNISSYFINTIGIPTQVVSNEDSVNSSLQSKNYHVAVLPQTLLDKDPYSLYGAEGNNLSAINANPRLSDYNFEDNIKKYSQSSLTDSEARNNVLDFFKKEFVSINLLRTNTEVNYSNSIKGFDNTLPEFYSYLTQLYRDLPRWHVETGREFK